MADRAFKIDGLKTIGAGALLLLLVLVVGPLVVLWLRGTSSIILDPTDLAAIRFTLLQAGLSALISVTLAVPLARALARRRFAGRDLLISLLGAPFILPVMVAVLGLLGVFGRAGLLNSFLGQLGIEPIRIYGLHGVLLAHVFFNLPLATRFILQGWTSIPSERFRLAASLAFSPRDMRRILEYPMLRTVIPGAFMIIFLICMTSFAVVLALGGGPKATTVELAIYQAFRFDFDLGRAAFLAGVQFGLGAIAAGVLLWVSNPNQMGIGLGRRVARWDAQTPIIKTADTLIILLTASFLLIPMAIIIGNGLPKIFTLPIEVYQSAFRSVFVALSSTFITITLSLFIAIYVVRSKTAFFSEIVGYIMLAASPLVIGAGLFIAVYPFADPAALALPVTGFVNAIMATPFVLRILVPPLRDIETNYHRLSAGLGLTGWPWLRILVLPLLRRPLGFGAGVAAALSMGDLGVIALFSDPQGATLPLQLFRLMGAYRMDDAAGAALLLLILSFGLFWIFDHGGRKNAST